MTNYNDANYLMIICDTFNRVKFNNNATYDIRDMKNDRMKFSINEHEYFFDIEFIEYIDMMIDDIDCLCEHRDIDIEICELISYDAIAQIDSRYVFHVNDTYIIIFNDENVDEFTTIENYNSSNYDAMITIN